MRFATCSLTLAIYLVALAANAGAQTLITTPSAFTVQQTLDRITSALKTKGIEPAARIDHAAAAKAVGMELPPTEVLLFGNPKLGTRLMQARPEIALDLPLKFLAWQDTAGKVWLSYTAPATLKGRYGVEGQDEVLANMTAILQGLATAGTQ